MAANPAYAQTAVAPQQLHATPDRRWLAGFVNLFRNENATWWRTRRWLINVLIWTLLINGVLASALYAPVDSTAPPPTEDTVDPSNPLVLGPMLLLVVGGLTTSIGAIITMQGTILDEKNSGTAEWILSKPVSRAAFILAKWSANVLASLLITIVLQGLLAYLLISARVGSALPVGDFVAAMNLLGLHLLFYLSLTLMLGALFDGRGAVLGIPLGLLLGAQLFLMAAPWLAEIMPWVLVIPPNGPDSLATLAMRGQPLPTITPIIATAAWVVIFVVVAMWRFGREEF
jgi:ABC-2 type transport system permease protein